MDKETYREVKRDAQWLLNQVAVVIGYIALFVVISVVISLLLKANGI